MANVIRLKQLINSFVVSSRPTAADVRSACTVEDINRVIENTAKLFSAFAQELEKQK